MGAITGGRRDGIEGCPLGDLGDNHRRGGCGAVETVSEPGGNSFGPTQSGGRVGDRTMASRVPAFRALSSLGPVRFPPVGYVSVVFFYEADT